MLYSSLWIKDSTNWAHFVEMPVAAFAAKVNEMQNQGLRPICVDSSLGADVFYSAVWVFDPQSAGTTRIVNGQTLAEHEQTVSEAKNGGFRPTWVSGCSRFGDFLYSSIWVPDEGNAWDITYGMDDAAFGTAFSRLKNEGFRPLCINPFAFKQPVYASAWIKDGQAWQARFGMNEQTLQENLNQFAQQGFFATCLSAYDRLVPNQTSYDVVWQQGAGVESRNLTGLTLDQHVAAVDGMRAQGFRPICVASFQPVMFGDTTPV